MSFAFQLRDSLRHRESQVAGEFAAGESLETVLTRHLLAVESSADTQLLTSILLLDGKQLWHGAAPSLPKSYCDAIDGIEIGPNVGSCGTAACLGQAVYVTDVDTDPLWKDYRELARQHGLRACWSTPIRSTEGAILGTFAVYHLTPRGPTRDEVEAIRLITGHVAQAIERASARPDGLHPLRHASAPGTKRGHLKLVGGNDVSMPHGQGGSCDEDAFSTRLETFASMFDRYAALAESRKLSDALKTVARDCRNLVDDVRRRQNDEDPA